MTFTAPTLPALPVFRQQILAMAFFIACITAVGAGRNAEGGEVTATTVEHRDGRFTVHSNLLIHLPVSRVRELLMDFENLPLINPGIQEVTLWTSNRSGHLRMQMRSELCVLLVCLNYRWVQEVRVLESGDIVTRFDPALSDFREGWVRYRLLAEGSYTRLITDAVLAPDFWFPPIVGPMIIKSKLGHEALETAAGIEALTHVDGDGISEKTRRIAMHGPDDSRWD